MLMISLFSGSFYKEGGSGKITGVFLKLLFLLTYEEDHGIIDLVPSISLLLRVMYFRTTAWDVSDDLRRETSR